MTSIDDTVQGRMLARAAYHAQLASQWRQLAQLLDGAVSAPQDAGDVERNPGISPIAPYTPRQVHARLSHGRE
jgi:hypothetical protein